MRKRLCIVLILLICLIATFVYAENNANEEQSNELKNQRDELQTQLDTANEDLSNVQRDLTENEEQLEKINMKIEKIELEFAEQEGKIAKLKHDISSIETDLKDINKKYKKQKKLFQKRLVAIYESGETTYLDILLRSKNLDDFLSSYFFINELAQIDENILSELEEKQNKMDLSIKKLENQQKELAITMENQTRVANTLQNTKKMRESFIAKLSDEEKVAQAKVDEINEQVRAINQQILAIAQDGMDEVYIGGEFAWPVPGYSLITSPFSMRVHPITGFYHLHTGVDIGAPMGTNFVAANDGIVTKAVFNVAYGNMVLIDHGGGISTLYAHGSEFLVETGQKVKRGDPVLKVGSTGYSTGPHAHFEVRINGSPVNPMPYITGGIIPGQENNDTEQTEENQNNGE